MAKNLHANVIVLGTVQVQLLAGVASPTAGLAAPVGSLYQRTNGQLWVKTGAGNADWSQVLLSGASSVQAFSYVASGAEGSSFAVSLPVARSSTNYLVFATLGDGDAALAWRLPQTGRTVNDFPMETSSALIAGDTFEFYVIDPTP